MCSDMGICSACSAWTVYTLVRETDWEGTQRVAIPVEPCAYSQYIVCVALIILWWMVQYLGGR